MSNSIWPLLVAAIENFVLMNGALSAAAFCVAVVMRRITRTRSWHPLSSSRIYATALVAPPLISAWLVIASMLPAIWLGADIWLQEHQDSHTLHLLNALTASANPVLGYSALAFVALASLLTAYAAVNAYFRIGRVIRKLDIDAEPATSDRIRQVEETCRQYGIDVGLVMSRYPFSFVWGYFRSKLVLSTGLLNVLSPEELSALLEHEAAHHSRRDNLSKWLLTFCQYVSPVFLLNRLLYRWWNQQIEMVCDEVAARRINAPVEVAGALVRIKRLTVAIPYRVQPSESAFLNENGENFELRVMRVLSLTERQHEKEETSLSRSWTRTATLVSSAFVLTLIAVFIASPLAIHRVVELLLHAF